jgi:hypothetical protein
MTLVGDDERTNISRPVASAPWTRKGRHKVVAASVGRERGRDGEDGGGGKRD